MKLQCLAGCMGFVWVHADSFLCCVASPFHSFVTIVAVLGCCPAVPAWCVICRVHPLAPVRVDNGEPSPSYLASVRSWLRRLQSCWVFAPALLPAPAPFALGRPWPVHRGAVADARLGLA